MGRESICSRREGGQNTVAFRFWDFIASETLLSTGIGGFNRKVDEGVFNKPGLLVKGRFAERCPADKQSEQGMFSYRTSTCIVASPSSSTVIEFGPTLSHPGLPKLRHGKGSSELLLFHLGEGACQLSQLLREVYHRSSIDKGSL